MRATNLIEINNFSVPFLSLAETTPIPVAPISAKEDISSSATTKMTSVSVVEQDYYKLDGECRMPDMKK